MNNQGNFWQDESNLVQYGNFSALSQAGRQMFQMGVSNSGENELAFSSQFTGGNKRKMEASDFLYDTDATKRFKLENMGIADRQPMLSSFLQNTRSNSAQNLNGNAASNLQFLNWQREAIDSGIIPFNVSSSSIPAERAFPSLPSSASYQANFPEPSNQNNLNLLQREAEYQRRVNQSSLLEVGARAIGNNVEEAGKGKINQHQSIDPKLEQQVQIIRQRQLEIAAMKERMRKLGEAGSQTPAEIRAAQIREIKEQMQGLGTQIKVIQGSTLSTPVSNLHNDDEEWKQFVENSLAVAQGSNRTSSHMDNWQALKPSLTEKRFAGTSESLPQLGTGVSWQDSSKNFSVSTASQFVEQQVPFVSPIQSRDFKKSRFQEPTKTEFMNSSNQIKMQNELEIKKRAEDRLEREKALASTLAVLQKQKEDKIREKEKEGAWEQIRRDKKTEITTKHEEGTVKEPKQQFTQNPKPGEGAQKEPNHHSNHVLKKQSEVEKKQYIQDQINKLKNFEKIPAAAEKKEIPKDGLKDLKNSKISISDTKNPKIPILETKSKDVGTKKGNLVAEKLDEEKKQAKVETVTTSSKKSPPSKPAPTKNVAVKKPVVVVIKNNKDAMKLSTAKSKTIDLSPIKRSSASLTVVKDVASKTETVRKSSISQTTKTLDKSSTDKETHSSRTAVKVIEKLGSQKDSTSTSLEFKNKEIQEQVKNLPEKAGSSSTIAAHKKKLTEDLIAKLSEKADSHMTRSQRLQDVAGALLDCVGTAEQKSLLNQIPSVADRAEVLKLLRPTERLHFLMLRSQQEQETLLSLMGVDELRKFLSSLRATDVKKLLIGWPPESKAFVLKEMTAAEKKALLVLLEASQQEQLVGLMSPKERVDLIKILPNLLDKLALLKLLPAAKQLELLGLMSYPEMMQLFGTMTPSMQLQLVMLMNPQERVQMVTSLQPQEQMRLMALVGVHDRVEIMSMLKPEEQLELILLMRKPDQEEIVSAMHPTELIRLMSAMTLPQKGQLLGLLKPQQQANLLMALPIPDQAALMSTLPPTEQFMLVQLVEETERQQQLLGLEQVQAGNFMHQTLMSNPLAQQSLLGPSPSQSLLGSTPFPADIFNSTAKQVMELDMMRQPGTMLDILGRAGHMIDHRALTGSQMDFIGQSNPLLDLPGHLMMQQNALMALPLAQNQHSSFGESLLQSAAGLQPLMQIQTTDVNFFQQENYLKNTERISWPNWRVQCALKVDLRTSSGLLIPCDAATFTDMFNNGYLCPVETCIKIRLQANKTPLYVYNVENQELLGTFAPVTLHEASSSHVKIWMDRAIYFPAVKMTTVENDEWTMILHQLLSGIAVPLVEGVVQRLCDRLCTALSVASAGLADMILQKHYSQRENEANPKLRMYLQQMASRKTKGDALNAQGESADWLSPWKACLYHNPKFSATKVKQIVKDKRFMFLGDSNTRGVYKDFVACYKGDGLVSQAEYRKKGEPTYRGDRLVKVANVGNSTQYEEIREYPSKPNNSDNTRIQYHFITRCWGNKIVSKLQDSLQTFKPDVIVMNSCLWDTTRYHDNEDAAIESYIENLNKLTSFLSANFTGIFIWYTCFPVSPKVNAALFGPMAQERQLKQIAQLSTLVPVANKICTVIARSREFEVVDFWKLAIQDFDQRSDDGCHWSAVLHREGTFQLISILESKLFNDNDGRGLH